MNSLTLFAEAQYQSALIQLDAAKKLLEASKINALTQKNESTLLLE
jgi:hypothetical protein